jgi:chemotaxis protein CheD
MMPEATRTMVRMGEVAVSRESETQLVSLGLGSCVGLALIDRTTGIAGLAHIVLPESRGNTTATPGKFADTAVPHLIDEVCRAGASRTRLQAVICGGAHMFGEGCSDSFQIGERNATATVAALEAHRIPLRARDIGGKSGRTVEVHVGDGSVQVRVLGAATRSL